VVCPCAAPRSRCQGLGRARCHPAGRRDRRAGWRLGDPALCSGGVKPSRAEKLGVVASHVDQNRELGIPAEAITGFGAGVTNTVGRAPFPHGPQQTRKGSDCSDRIVLEPSRSPGARNSFTRPRVSSAPHQPHSTSGESNVGRIEPSYRSAP
jgi:hypothetical protein